jgi:Ca2+-binding RTX toxin-like protein
LNWFSASANQLARIEFADGTVWTRLDIADAAVIGRGTEGDDTLYGSHIRDTLEGLAGDDKLFGYAENDTLSGGTGNDTLYGGAGNDTYLWNPGDGSDVIVDSEGNNVLVIGGGLAAGDLKIDRSGGDISFLVSGTEEKITVKDWYAAEKNQLSEIRFSDGSVLTREEINLVTPVFEVKDGEDTASGSAGDDLVLGGSGDETLYGNAGNDIISGGEGDDRLIGGAGDDTYIWNPGDGNDTITDTLGDNTLQIGGGVNPGDVEVSREGNNLVITIPETGETITVTNWGSSENARLYEVQFSDGTVWDTDYIDGLLPPIELSTQDLTINGTAANDVLTGGFGSDKLYGLGGNDVLNGGDGNDSLYGGDGNDILAGGTGSDYLEGGTGNDVYVWNLGDGDDTINDTGPAGIITKRPAS